MSESRTILELCHALPDSEPELRARNLEFTRQVCVAVMGWRETPDAIAVAPNRDITYFEPLASILGTAHGSEIGTVLVYPPDAPSYGFNPLAEIADAKAATDAMIAEGWHFQVMTGNNSPLVYSALLAKDTMVKDRMEFVIIVSRASAEEIARAACALLAAEAMRDSERANCSLCRVSKFGHCRAHS